MTVESAAKPVLVSTAIDTSEIMFPASGATMVAQECYLCRLCTGSSQSLQQHAGQDCSTSSADLAEVANSSVTVSSLFQLL